tara:strand:+ start:2013 stop:2633 length:621 start_codon:yes stop_codon:yes gene_type:complete
MKFYFDGCSFTYGSHLDWTGYDPLEYRWSKLVCYHVGAEECNYSSGGASNDAILRHLFTRDDLEDFDMFFIQTTFTSRGEFFDGEKWKQYRKRNLYSAGQDGKKNPELQSWTDYYLKNIYSQELGGVKETIMVRSIESHLKLLNKPYFLSTIIDEPLMDYDLEINKITRDFNTGKKGKKYDRLLCGHPSPDGHRQIADDVIAKLNL